MYSNAPVREGLGCSHGLECDNPLVANNPFEVGDSYTLCLQCVFFLSNKGTEYKTHLLEKSFHDFAAPWLDFSAALVLRDFPFRPMLPANDDLSLATPQQLWRWLHHHRIKKGIRETQR